ncbi:BTAD domain-containing putative transcriptional regulator [Kribbella sp. CA-293567]|uniref:BTAD domain-containing putative transcriptional regulator n=1 Tax=Kribbella sp. CA-293567 TaxID=3002436 RepID=UPI0022DD52A9|nr:BTAD domain-containing putative transcriptional regulator [Kribbella sp. CA-293567]WBQ05389.1 BTAD domain-containing putative transcriptional regulator [Kribbella sp. CA-293567]
MYFEVLGPLVVRTDAGDPVVVPDTKVRTLLLDLLINLGRPVSADRLIDDLWGDHPPRNASGTLQARVSQLRTALARAEPGGRALITHGPGGYRLDVPQEVVDSNEFERLTAPGSRRAEVLQQALGLWRGPAYAEVADREFARAARDRLEELRLAATEELLEIQLDRGSELQRVLAGVAELVARHPLRERARGTQLRALYRAGRQHEALKAFADYRELLAEELGADPGPELAALHQAILRHDPALTAAGGSRLPVPLNELIGREAVAAEAMELLGKTRLLTLIGPGGVGKTRLALELAREAAAPNEAAVVEQVMLVELAALQGVDVLDAVAAGVGLRDDVMGMPAPVVGRELGKRLVGALEARPTLLVLDNCEHLVEAAADLVGMLLVEAPGLRVLATSREPLGLAGEHLLEVGPLEPAAAAQLFRERAAAAGAGDSLRTEDAAVDGICQRLDGIPLALELAATRVRALGVQGLAAKLDDRFRLLAGGRGVPERQRTLRATIDWSWELLSDEEQVLLRRLAVHADSFSLQAAEEVGELPAEVLARLVDRSLVVSSEGRYRLLESVAAYSLERLVESGEEPRLRRRHTAYYVSLAEQAEPHLRGAEQVLWLRQLDLESANLRLALQYASPESALRLVNAMAWYWYLRGRLSEGRRALATALAVPGPANAARAAATVWSVGFAATAADGSNLTAASAEALTAYDSLDDPLGQARAEWFLTATQWAYGGRQVLLERIERATATFTRLDDQWGLAAALSTRAELSLTHVDLAALRRDGLRSLELFDKLGDRWGQLQASYSLIVAAEIAGEYAVATRLLQEALRVAEELGMWTEVSFRTAGLGRIALLTGEYDQADELHERARRLAIEQSNKSAEEYAEVGLGLVARRRGELDKAEEHLANWLPWLRQVGGDSGVAFILTQLGFIADQRGDYVAALQLQQEAHALAVATGDERAIALTLEGLAGAKAGAGQADEAAELLDRAEKLRQAVGAPLPEGERADVERIRRRLDEVQRG